MKYLLLRNRINDVSDLKKLLKEKGARSNLSSSYSFCQIDQNTVLIITEYLKLSKNKFEDLREILDFLVSEYDDYDSNHCILFSMLTNSNFDLVNKFYEEMHEFLPYFLDAQCYQDKDSFGNDSISYAIINNNASLVRALLTEDIVGQGDLEKYCLIALQNSVSPMREEILDFIDDHMNPEKMDNILKNYSDIFPSSDKIFSLSEVERALKRRAQKCECLIL